jgi:hypothetical protein
MEVVVTGGEDYVIGCRLAIKTTLGDDIEGTVLAYDSSRKIVVLHILSFSLLFFNWHRGVVIVLRFGFCFPTSGDVAAVPGLWFCGTLKQMLSVSRYSLACSRPRNQTLALTPCEMLMTSLSAASSSISSLFFFQQPVQNNVFFASHYP